MHHLYVLRGKPPVSLCIEVSKIDLLLVSSENIPHGPGDFSGHKGLSPSGRLVVKEDAVAGEKTVALPVVHRHPVGIHLGGGVGAAGSEGRGLMENVDAEDLAQLLRESSSPWATDYFVNVGTGKDIKLKDLFHLVKEIVGYKGDIIHDLSKPDGTPRKLLDVSRIHALGWQPEVSLEEGIKKTYQWYVGSGTRGQESEVSGQ